MYSVLNCGPQLLWYGVAQLAQPTELSGNLKLRFESYEVFASYVFGGACWQGLITILSLIQTNLCTHHLLISLEGI